PVQQLWRDPAGDSILSFGDQYVDHAVARANDAVYWLGTQATATGNASSSYALFELHDGAAAPRVVAQASGIDTSSTLVVDAMDAYWLSQTELVGVSLATGVSRSLGTFHQTRYLVLTPDAV